MGTAAIMGAAIAALYLLFPRKKRGTGTKVRNAEGKKGNAPARVDAAAEKIATAVAAVSGSPSKQAR